EATVAKFEKAAVALLLRFLRRRAEADGLPDLRLSLQPQRLEDLQRGPDLRVFLDLPFLIWPRFGGVDSRGSLPHGSPGAVRQAGDEARLHGDAPGRQVLLEARDAKAIPPFRLGGFRGRGQPFLLWRTGGRLLRRCAWLLQTWALLRTEEVGEGITPQT